MSTFVFEKNNVIKYCHELMSYILLLIGNSYISMKHNLNTESFETKNNTQFLMKETINITFQPKTIF